MTGETELEANREQGEFKAANARSLTQGKADCESSGGERMRLWDSAVVSARWHPRLPRKRFRPQAVSPITWLPAAMRHGDIEDVVRLNGVDHQVRKDAHQAVPYVAFQHAPALRSLEDLADGDAHFRREAAAQTATALAVETHRLLEFRSGFGVEDVPHLRSSRSTRS